MNRDSPNKDPGVLLCHVNAQRLKKQQCRTCPSHSALTLCAGAKGHSADHIGDGYSRSHHLHLQLQCGPFVNKGQAPVDH